ncbi:MAG: hypothetical protein MMC33_007880 [Icmadophila ericetorum]|nr:hypothetical protein [Icmadophila ericetorum]
MKLLLNLGSNIHAKVRMGEGKRQFSTLESAMQSCLFKDPTKEEMDITRVLFKQGADYLRNFDGYPIIFSATKHFELIKFFFDCIGPEASRLVVQVRNARKETMLHTAFMWAKLDVVELLLKNGADPGVRDMSGYTAYAKLLGRTSLQGKINWVPIQGLMAFATKEQFNQDDASRMLSLLEQLGGDACAIDDEAFSKKEVERMLSSDALFQQQQPSLEIWAENRAKGLISSGDLPEDWSEFFQEANREMGRLLTSWMEPDQIPQITEELEEHVTSLGVALFKIYLEDLKVSWTTKIFGLQRLNQIWKALSRGEILDLLYKLAVMANVDTSRDHTTSELNLDLQNDSLSQMINDYTIFQTLRSGAKTPASALKDLSLPKKYSDVV